MTPYDAALAAAKTARVVEQAYSPRSRAWRHAYAAAADLAERARLSSARYDGRHEVVRRAIRSAARDVFWAVR